MVRHELTYGPIAPALAALGSTFGWVSADLKAPTKQPLATYPEQSRHLTRACSWEKPFSWSYIPCSAKGLGETSPNHTPAWKESTREKGPPLGWPRDGCGWGNWDNLGHLFLRGRVNVLKVPAYLSSCFSLSLLLLDLLLGFQSPCSKQTQQDLPMVGPAQTRLSTFQPQSVMGWVSSQAPPCGPSYYHFREDERSLTWASDPSCVLQSLNKTDLNLFLAILSIVY